MKYCSFYLIAAGVLLSNCTPATSTDSGISDSAADTMTSSDVVLMDAIDSAVADASLDVVSDTSTLDAGDPLEAQWQQIESLPNVWIYRAREAYKDAQQTQRVLPNDEITSFRSLGTGIPSVNNVPNVANLQWMGVADFQSSANPVWYASFGRRPTFVNRGNHDEYVRFINGLPTNYETEPGSLTPALARGEVFHAVHLFRAMPGASYEGILAGLVGYKDRAGDGSQLLVQYGNTTLLGTSGKTARWGEDNIVEFLYRANGDVEVSLNGEVVLTGNLPGLSAAGYTEFVLGTNSHVLANHFRAIIMRRGAVFSATELATIRTVTQALWPRGVKPQFPYLDGQFRNNYLDWNTTTKTWQPAVGTFSGGNGTAGQHVYQWYYWIDPGPTGTWPRNNVLDYHLPFPGPRGRLPTLSRADYSAGNSYGNPVVFATPGTSQVKVMRLVTPVDSAGTQGEPLPGNWALDNIP